jgi:hypothetical protein
MPSAHVMPPVATGSCLQAGVEFCTKSPSPDTLQGPSAARCGLVMPSVDNSG